MKDPAERLGWQGLGYHPRARSIGFPACDRETILPHHPCAKNIPAGGNETECSRRLLIMPRRFPLVLPLRAVRADIGGKNILHPCQMPFTTPLKKIEDLGI